MRANACRMAIVRKQSMSSLFVKSQRPIDKFAGAEALPVDPGIFRSGT